MRAYGASLSNKTVGGIESAVGDLAIAADVAGLPGLARQLVGLAAKTTVVSARGLAAGVARIPGGAAKAGRGAYAGASRLVAGTKAAVSTAKQALKRKLRKTTADAAEESREQLLAELAANGVKHKADEVLNVGRQPDGKIVFLEKGNDRSGLNHIIERHKSQFSGEVIPEDEIARTVHKAAREGNTVGHESGALIFATTVNNLILQLKVVIDDNGYIVTAHPKTL